MQEEEKQKIALLVARCNRGERRAWEELYSRYHGLVARVVSQYDPSGHGDHEDAVQEVFFNLFKALQRYDPNRPLEAYIVEIARRVRVSTYRRFTASKRRGGTGSTISLDVHNFAEGGYVSVVGRDKDQESLLGDLQEARLLRKALGAISEACRELLALRYDRGLPYKEMAEILGEREGTLRVKVQRCLASLGRSFRDLTSDGVNVP